MEGHGFLEAARATTEVFALVVRGISDLIENKAQSDGEGWQPKAASHAAAFAFEILARFKTGDESLIYGSSQHIEPGPPSTQVSSKRPLEVPPIKVGGTPPTRAKSFTGRGEELEQIRSILRAGDSSELSSLVVHGLSGVGKTQLCRRYMELHQADYRLTRWISADEEARVIADLAQLAIDRQFPRFDREDLVRSSNAALQWLEQHDRWLLIFDNASPYNVGALLPSRGSGHILISSNNPNWSSITANQIRLRGLSPEDGVQFLVQRTGLKDTAAATRIANSFDCLPLALEQAASYIQVAGIDFHDYEQLLEEHRPEVLDEKSPFTEYPESVYSALMLNVDRASDGLPHVTTLLAFISHWNPPRPGDGCRP